jgi:tRNA threonylcarbamoyladenosine biosynthesis protein TsaB
MIVLAFDTAMAGCSAALYDAVEERVLASRFFAMSKGHADAIAPLIREMMEEAGIGFGALGRIGVTIGPGTFTGVRTGLAMARGLGLSLDIPVVGLDTLSAIACNEAGNGTPVAVAADARRGEVYLALFSRDLRMIEPPQVLAIAEAARRLPEDPVAVMGTGAEALISAAAGRSLVRSDAGDLPRATAFIRRIANMTPEPIPPEPLYLRPPDARPQERLATRGRPSFAIQPADAGAANLLAQLHAECFDNPWTGSDMARLMAMPGAIALLASEEGEPSAFLIARQAADEAEILALGTRPFARRRGAARALMEKLESEIVHRGALALFIEVARSNVEAQRLYQALGFSNAGTRRNYYEKPGGSREDAVIMRKDLAT